VTSYKLTKWKPVDILFRHEDSVEFNGEHAMKVTRTPSKDVAILKNSRKGQPPARGIGGRPEWYVPRRLTLLKNRGRTNREPH
jgi:hypothetical protein